MSCACDVNDSLDGSDVMIAKMKSAAELRESDAFVIFAPFALCILLLRNNLRWGACKGFGSCRPFSRLNNTNRPNCLGRCCSEHLQFE